MNGWNGCDLQLCYLVQFIFTGVGQYIQPIIATNYGGGNCGVIHQCHVFEIFYFDINHHIYMFNHHTLLISFYLGIVIHSYKRHLYIMANYMLKQIIL